MSTGYKTTIVHKWVQTPP